MQVPRRMTKVKSDQRDVSCDLRQAPDNVKFIDDSAISPRKTIRQCPGRARDGGGEGAVSSVCVRNSDRQSDSWSRCQNVRPGIDRGVNFYRISPAMQWPGPSPAVLSRDLLWFCTPVATALWAATPIR